MNFRRKIAENGGDLPLTGVLELTRADRKANFIKLCVEFLESVKGEPLTAEEIEKQGELWENSQPNRTNKEREATNND